MFSSLFQSTTIPTLEQVINFNQTRHGLLAGNLANMDTPGYRVRDLSPERFQSQLKEALQAKHQPAKTTSPGENPYDRFHHVKDSLKSIFYHDESDVSLEHQVAEMAKNQAQHNLALTVMTSQFRLLQAAISEQVV